MEEIVIISLDHLDEINKMRKLNIPIKRITTRRNSRRVVWNIIGFSVIFFAMIFCLQLFLALDSTSSSAPEEAIYTLRLLKTKSNARILNEFAGETTMLPVIPTNLANIILQSKGEFSLHFDSIGLVGITIDGTIDEKTKELVRSTGSFVYSNEKTTLLSLNEQETVIFNTNLSLKTAIYGTDGEFIEKNGGKNTLSVSKKGITIHGAGQKQQINSQIAMDQSSKLLAIIEIEQNSAKIPVEMYKWLGIPSNAKLFTEIRENGAKIIIARDETGIVYSISIPSNQLNIDELVLIGGDIMNRASLTTQAWTNSYGEKYTEIVVNNEHIELSIHAEEDFSNILLSNRDGQVLRISKSLNNVVIANRTISAEISDFSAISTCLSTAHMFINYSELIEEFATSTSYLASFEQTLFTPFNYSEVAVASHRTRFCW